MRQRLLMLADRSGARASAAGRVAGAQAVALGLLEGRRPEHDAHPVPGDPRGLVRTWPHRPRRCVREGARSTRVCGGAAPEAVIPALPLCQPLSRRRSAFFFQPELSVSNAISRVAHPRPNGDLFVDSEPGAPDTAERRRAVGRLLLQAAVPGAAPRPLRVQDDSDLPQRRPASSGLLLGAAGRLLLEGPPSRAGSSGLTHTVAGMDIIVPLGVDVTALSLPVRRTDGGVAEPAQVGQGRADAAAVTATLLTSASPVLFPSGAAPRHAPLRGDPARRARPLFPRRLHVCLCRLCDSLLWGPVGGRPRRVDAAAPARRPRAAAPAAAPPRRRGGRRRLQRRRDPFDCPRSDGASCHDLGRHRGDAAAPGRPAATSAAPRR